MKRISKSLIAFLLLIFIAITTLHGYRRADAATYEEQMDELRKKQEELEKQKEEEEKRKAEFESKKLEAAEYLASLTDDITKVTLYIQEVDAQLQEIYMRLDTLNFQISVKAEEIEQTKQELEESIIRQQNQYEAMKKRIRYIYENGSESMWEVFVNAKSLEDILNRIEYRIKITEYDNSLLERYETATQLVITNKQLLESQMATLEEMKAEAEEEKTACEALAARKGEQLEAYMQAYNIEDELLFKYSEEIDNATSSLEDIYAKETEYAQKAEELRIAEEKRIEEERKRKEEEERRRREEEAARVKAEQEARRKAEEEARRKAEAELLAQRLHAAEGVVMTLETDINKMIWPLPGDGRTYSGFGPRVAPLPGASTFHLGVDIGGEFGATIVATIAGTVEIAGYNSSAGNYVQINHGNGVVTKYLHASKLLVKAGDYVMQGQPVALVGSTGISTGPHLHFSVVVNGTFVDPMKYIKYTGK